MRYNYGGLEEEYTLYDNAEIVIVPVPFDGTSTWIKGADKGPDALLEASANMELYDIESDHEFYTIGINTSEAVEGHENPESMVADVEKRISGILADRKFPIVLGGEHSVSIGAIKAFHSHFENLTVLQLDAHSDMRQEYEGSPYNHACVMARAAELGDVVQIGIRSMCVEERQLIDRKRVFFAHELSRPGNWMEDALRLLNDNVYITIDLDAFDPSIMPSTGTPEPGGLFWYETLDFLSKVFSRRNVVGFDVVELCPNENNRASDFLAAKLVYKMIGMKFFNS